MFKHLRHPAIFETLNNRDLSEKDIGLVFEGWLVHPRHAPAPRDHWLVRSAFWAIGAGTLIRFSPVTKTLLVYGQKANGTVFGSEAVPTRDDLTQFFTLDDLLVWAAPRVLGLHEKMSRSITGLPWEIALITDLDAQRAAVGAYARSVP